MLKECLEVFGCQLKEKGDALILDSYIPVDGTYIIIDKDGNQKAIIDVKMDKKTRILDRSQPFFEDICFYDYHSQLISMNKPMDGKKIIHSNSYLSFFVKKDSVVTGKLTDEVIDGYYEILKNPVEQKYKKSKEATKMYKLFEAEEGSPDANEVEKKKQWIKEHIYSMEEVDMTKKEYLKIFFEADREEYEREGRRYFLPNIYNNNDYNIEIENVMYGLPDNNLGMNTKKPFLSIKSRKYAASYLLDRDEVIFQKKFFDYLMNLVSSGQYHVYIDTDRKKIIGCRSGEALQRIESGYYLRLKKGKTEAEIHYQDNISGYNQKLKKPFEFLNIAGARCRKHLEYEERYRRYYNRVEIGSLINEVFFSNCLAGNYTLDVGDIKLTDEILKQSVILSRNTLFDWVYIGNDRGFEKIIEKVSLDLIKGALLNGYQERAMWQLNLRWSFREYFSQKGDNDMAEIISSLKERLEKKVFADHLIPLDNNDEYYYAVGQLAAFLISLNKSKNKNQSLVNPFLNAKTDSVIKKRLLQLYKKYNYDIIEQSKKVKNLIAMVEGYKPEGKVNQEMIILGYASDNLIYKTEEK